MTVTAVAPSTSIYSTTPTTPPNQTMDSQMFLQLLITQLQSQSPDSPMDSNTMITQTSQLASMQAMSTMSDTETSNYTLQTRTAAAALIGKNASYVDSNGVTQSGDVTGVSFDSSDSFVTIGGVSVPIEDLSAVSTTSTAAPTS
ncbi:MAG: flagellar basal-body rod modification protein FlgD [Actinomycetota bacterium]|jgi:flagellar basal-body rod modification protein FlgD|nr:flagellar basal-body rod modification protein FlgD [Actinomycetota bacterium]MDQ1562425.1 flagellar basal-body rod modification protein FlgD [Actinomycetota bacterium]MDQ1563562.1 flagellar basal-body rod modification protein FlgD [Actinomycetota bacterium]MDQ1573029.1 flagellar basal-body rod modification protein FlgD [Actinomycetota bacterium]